MLGITAKVVLCLNWLRPGRAAIVVPCIRLLVVVTLLSSCGITKRRYMPGYHVDPFFGKVDRSPESGIQLGTSMYRIAHDKRSLRYFDDGFSLEAMRVSILLHDYFLAGAVRLMSFTPREEFAFNGKWVGPDDLILHNALDLQFGRSLFFHQNYSFDPYVGYLYTTFLIRDEKDLGIARGLSLGFMVQWYLREWKPPNESGRFTIFLNYNYNMANYHQAHPDLGRFFHGISLGVSMRGLFEKKGAAKPSE